MNTVRLATPALVAVAAAAIFAMVTAEVVGGRTRTFDRSVLRWVRAHRSHVLRPLLRPLAWASGPAALVPVTLASAAWVYRKRRNVRAALVIASVPFIAMTVGESCTRLLPPRRAPDASSWKRIEPCYPSGRTTGITAEALATGYILAREELVSTSLVAALAACALVVGASRIYRERHWATDVIVGWVNGIGVAALSALAYELGRPVRSRRAAAS